MSSNFLIPFRKKDKWGFYSSADKKIVIPCTYLNASVFADVPALKEELAIVEEDGLFGKIQFYINTKGEKAIKLKHKYCWVTEYSNDKALCFAKVAQKKFSGIKIGVIDEQGRYIAKCEFEDCALLADGDREREKILPVNRNHKWGVISSYGDRVFPFIFDHIHNYSEGFAVCVFGLKETIGNSKRYNKGLIQIPEAPCYGFIDKKGNIVNHKFFYKAAKSFSEGLAAVQKPMDKKGDETSQWGFINTEFEDATAFVYEDAKSFSNGMAAVKHNERWGFIDKNGIAVIDFKYEDVHSFFKSLNEEDDSSLTAVKLNDQWGFIDKAGNEVIEFKYENASAFYNGIAAVCINNKWGFINNKGQLIIPCKYDWIAEKQNRTNTFTYNPNARLDKDFTFSNARLIKVCLNNKIGFIDLEGKEYWEN